MLSKEDNDILTRVGPGTPMGNLLRRYWTPALLSSELPAPDSPPVRVRLLGEDLSPVRTAAPASSSGATRSAACAASTTAGSSTSTGAASTCPPSLPRATSRAR